VGRLAVRGDLGRAARLSGAPAALLLALLAALCGAPAARAQDPGRWVLSQVDRVPVEYLQGLTHTPAPHWVFAGPYEGLYRVDRSLRELARVLQPLPGEARIDGFNHIGDPAWDAGEGGRLLLPLECYVVGAPNNGNTCGRGAIGVADPRTLMFRYVVPLDPADIPKAMWAEVAPGGRELWTSSGRDLLAYRIADIAPGATAPIRPARRLRGAVPPSGVTGAAFYRGRLFLAGQATGRLQVWSVDAAAGGLPVFEAELDRGGESEGLDVLRARHGLLHWLVAPRALTAGATFNELLSFVPAADAALRVRAEARGRRVTVRVAMTISGRAQRVSGAAVRVGSARGRTGAGGSVTLTAARAGTLRVVATKERLAPGRTRVTVR